MKKKIQCPSFPFFGASYPDTICMDGLLHDADDCADNGDIYLKDEPFPCPFCNGEEYVKWASNYYSINWAKAREMKNALRAKYNPVNTPAPLINNIKYDNKFTSNRNRRLK